MPMPEHCSNCDKPRPEGGPCKCETPSYLDGDFSNIPAIVVYEWKPVEKKKAGERVDGDFFWVRIGSEWSIANQNAGGEWWLFGCDYTDSGIEAFDEIGPKVEPPDEIKRRVE